MTQPPTPETHELDYWLSEELARVTPPTADSVLRALAWNRGQLRGFWAALRGTGLTLALTALLILVVRVDLALLSLALLLAALSCWAGVRASARRVGLRTTPLPPSRAPRSMAGGLLLSALLIVVIGVLIFPVLNKAFGDMPQAPWLIPCCYLLLVLLSLSLFAAPAWYASRARQSFRREIAQNPEVRAQLADMARQWVDPIGSRPFGPL